MLVCSNGIHTQHSVFVFLKSPLTKVFILSRFFHAIFMSKKKGSLFYRMYYIVDLIASSWFHLIVILSPVFLGNWMFD